MIRFPDRDPTGFCNSEPDPGRTGFRKTQPDQIWISKLHRSLQYNAYSEIFSDISNIWKVLPDLARTGLLNENVGLD